MTHIVAAATLPLLLAVLAGCSSTAAATTKPAAAPQDYGKAETAATVAFVHKTPVLGGRVQDALDMVKAYCEMVAQKGVKATNRDDLYLTDAATVAAWEKAAGLYCPVTMKVAG